MKIRIQQTGLKPSWLLKEENICKLSWTSIYETTIVLLSLFHSSCHVKLDSLFLPIRYLKFFILLSYQSLKSINVISTDDQCFVYPLFISSLFPLKIEY